MSNQVHRTIELSAAEWQRLDELAVQTRSRPTKGTAAYAPSWKTLLRRIANGEVGLYEIDPYQLPAGLVEQAEAVTERQRLEQARMEQQRRVQAHTAAKQAVRKTPVKMQQLSMLELELA